MALAKNLLFPFLSLRGIFFSERNLGTLHKPVFSLVDWRFVETPFKKTLLPKDGFFLFYAIGAAGLLLRVVV